MASTSFPDDAGAHRVRRAALAWGLALAAAGVALAALGYGSRDADSRLYATMAARMSTAAAPGWIAPEFPPAGT